MLWTLALAGCDGSGEFPDREPEAVGVASAVETDGGETRITLDPAAGYEYFDGAVFTLDAGVKVSGAVDMAADIPVGADVELWASVCAESFPVQCPAQAVKVLD